MDYSNAITCAILAKEIYQDFANIKFSEFPTSAPELIQNPGTDTQCAILPGSEPKTLYLVFRGTEKNEDWKTNVDFSRDLFEIRWTELQQGAQPAASGPTPRQILRVDDSKTDLAPDAPRALMHEGFVRAYMSVQDEIHRYLRDHDFTQITITGHSLGAALATLCAIDIQLTYEGQYAIEIYTFGSPRVGNPSFRDLFNQQLPKTYRFRNGLDIVPDLPRPWQGYRHVETEYQLGSRFSWKFFSRRVTDHYMSAYLTALQTQAGS